MKDFQRLKVWEKAHQLTLILFLFRSRAMSEKMDERVNPVAVNVTNFSPKPQLEGENQEKTRSFAQYTITNI